jgi:hypothetical protein
MLNLHDPGGFMKEYKLSNGGVIQKADGAFIPDCEGNRDWQAYQDWLAKGNTPDPVEQPTNAELRVAEYPPMVDFLDGFAKSKSSDAVIAAEGTAQMDAYAAECLKVKEKYPKE